MKNLCFTCLMCTGLLVEAAADFTPQWCISKSNAKYVKIEEYGGDWTYHSFREALWWNVETVLDPATGKQAMELIDEMQQKTGAAVIIIEHRLEDVLHRDVDRIVLMHEGRIILDISGEEKKHLTVEMLMDAFARTSGETFANDRILLS